ncbi:MAG TPA: FliH/SctL family protein [Bryobacteraceae bacterium]|nr:FliH/SctL family protein [Bryobacteraceae bacterium]
MLSKVLSGSETKRARPVAFLSAELPAPNPEVARAASESEMRALRAEIARLRSEIDSVRIDAFESGKRQGEETARSEISKVMERMIASIAELIGMRQELRRSAEKDVVQLALLIAKKVLHRQLSVDPGALTALARVVFERIASAESYRVTVNPRFAESIRSALPARSESKIRVEPDPNCAPGAFLVQSDDGTIDASVDNQLEEIGRGLADRLAGI